jgi:hypothetical protein
MSSNCINNLNKKRNKFLKAISTDFYLSNLRKVRGDQMLLICCKLACFFIFFRVHNEIYSGNVLLNHRWLRGVYQTPSQFLFFTRTVFSWSGNSPSFHFTILCFWTSLQYDYVFFHISGINTDIALLLESGRRHSTTWATIRYMLIPSRLA